MKFCSLASGSSGNCLYLKAGDTAILVDAGISCKKICEGLDAIGESPRNIKACFVTHDHSDHIKGIPVLMRKFGIPVYATGGTLTAIALSDKKELPRERMYELVPDREVTIGELKVMPFRISHDAADPVCYTIKHGDRKLGMATDLGEFTDYTVKHLLGSNALYVEANHDVNMLMMGPYPYQLKLRIDSPIGHLSNEACGNMVSKLLFDGLQTVMLAHISVDNNFEELAYQTVKTMVDDTAQKMGISAPKIVVADRYCVTDIFEV
ncbi:MAG: MBL fold metallo-hydrolase [Lachnospiraceae bacterium]|nr:MBL fold metallo-hydrolase [Lachnospiraceae bacterium]